MDRDALLLKIFRKNIHVKMLTICDMSLCAFILEGKVWLWTRSPLRYVSVRAFESKESLPLCCFVFMSLFHAVLDSLVELLSFLVCNRNEFASKNFSLSQWKFSKTNLRISSFLCIQYITAIYTAFDIIIIHNRYKKRSWNILKRYYHLEADFDTSTFCVLLLYIYQNDLHKRARKNSNSTDF